MTTLTAGTRRLLRHGRYALAVTPVVRWLIAHHSVAFGQPWRTRCDTCATTLWPGACTPRGRCAGCGHRTGTPSYLPEVIMVVIAVMLIDSGARGWELAAWIWYAMGLTVLAFVDATFQRLPYRITAATTAGTILLLVPAGASASTWINAGIGAACLTGFYAAIHALAPNSLGAGDVALAVPIGLVAGWDGWRLVLIVPLLAHILASLVLVYRKVRYAVGEPLPLGTFLAVASLLVLALP